MHFKFGRRFEVDFAGNLYLKLPWIGGRLFEAYWDRSGSIGSTYGLSAKI